MPRLRIGGILYMQASAATHFCLAYLLVAWIGRNHMAHILIVEDDAHSAKLLNVRLAHLGHTIMVAQDGIQAFACIQAQAPDLILLDVMLPRMSGFQVLEQLKLNRTTNRIPVLMLTVRTDTQSIR